MKTLYESFVWYLEGQSSDEGEERHGSLGFSPGSGLTGLPQDLSVLEPHTELQSHVHRRLAPFSPTTRQGEVKPNRGTNTSQQSDTDLTS